MYDVRIFAYIHVRCVCLVLTLYICNICLCMCVLMCVCVWQGHGGSVVKFCAFRPEGRRFEFHCSHHIRTLGKSFTHSCP